MRSEKEKEGKEPAATVSRTVVEKNMPPVAGLLKWTQELRHRIQPPVQKLRKIPDRRWVVCFYVEFIPKYTENCVGILCMICVDSHVLTVMC